MLLCVFNGISSRNKHNSQNVLDLAANYIYNCLIVGRSHDKGIFKSQELQVPLHRSTVSDTQVCLLPD